MSRNWPGLALLLALATVIHTAEAFLPVTVGWLRFGFANIIGLATLYLYGFKDALVVTLGRIFLGSLASAFSDRRRSFCHWLEGSRLSWPWGLLTASELGSSPRSE